MIKLSLFSRIVAPFVTSGWLLRGVSECCMGWWTWWWRSPPRGGLTRKALREILSGADMQCNKRLPSIHFNREFTFLVHVKGSTKNLNFFKVMSFHDDDL